MKHLKFIPLFAFLFYSNVFCVPDKNSVPTKISLSSDIKVKNKSDLVVYAATYYKKKIFGFECEKWGGTSIFEPTVNKMMERPPLEVGYDRRLVLSINSKDLKDKLTEHEYKLQTKVPIGNMEGEKFYICSRANALVGYNNLEWRILKPFMEVLNKTTDSIFDFVIKKVIKHEYINNPASVRFGKELGEEESVYLKKRKKKVKKSTQKFLDKDLKDKQTPNIAFCLSGGGYRGMIGALGTLLGAKEIGLLDCVTYIASLSGSSWLVAPWIASGYDLDKFSSKLRDSVQHEFFTPFVDYTELSEELIKKILFRQNVSLVDLWGFLIANRMMSMFGDKKHDVNFSNFSNKFLKGKMPLPIHVAAEALKDYKWFEFTPFEIGSMEFGMYVPSWAFGREFLDGKSMDFAPPQSLGYLMGVFGAALSANFREMLLDLRRKLQKKSRFNLADFITEQTSIGDVRVSPAKIFNFMYGMEKSPFRNEKELTFVDPGLDFALPFPPLVRSERKIDIIITSDSSNTTIGAPSLKKAEKYARERNLKFPQIDYTIVGKEMISIFKDENDPTVPIVIYLPLIKNNKYSRSFDPEKEKDGGFCSMYNFSYTNKEFDLLSGLTKFNMVECKDKIMQVVKEVVDRKLTV